jgi:hypothetical protein
MGFSSWVGDAREDESWRSDFGVSSSRSTAQSLLPPSLPRQAPSLHRCFLVPSPHRGVVGSVTSDHAPPSAQIGAKQPTLV